MRRDDVALGLREMADELKPFIRRAEPSPSPRNTPIWGGSSPQQPVDCYALAWWSGLADMAGLMEAQDSDLSPKQIEYLKRTLFGGMGSFSDFYLDRRDHGEPADMANQRLKEKRSKVFAVLTE